MLVPLIELAVVVAVLFTVAVVVSGRARGLADAPSDAVDPGLPVGRLAAGDLAGVRFGLAFRGYRMAEVDAVLDRLAAELAERDAEFDAPHAVDPTDGLSVDEPSHRGE